MEVFRKQDCSSLPVKSWCPEIEDSAKAQIQNLSNLPFIHSHVAVMPDCHTGYGMPIGGVIMTRGVIIPNAVGVDIGCGMIAVKLPMNRETHPKFGTEDLKFILGRIRDKIPVGFKKHKINEAYNNINNMPNNGNKPFIDYYPVVYNQFDNALKSLGTLGGGNHFIEIQIDEDTNFWIMIHSGSRNLGKQVADRYNKLAVEMNEKNHSVVDKKQELAFLPIDTEEANLYTKEMGYCIKFASANRKVMLQRVVDIFYEYMDRKNAPLEQADNDVIECIHNYAIQENHFGVNGWVHRKGAVKADMDRAVIIPGSQGTQSYIGEGLGSPDSFKSCSHGAGRLMGRKQAKKTLILEEEQKKLDDQGIIHSVRSESNLDEASGAYKDIDMVMANQTDLVGIVHTLKPIAVIKG